MRAADSLTRATALLLTAGACGLMLAQQGCSPAPTDASSSSQTLAASASGTEPAPASDSSASSEPVSAPASDQAASDGGAEQLPDEPLPPGGSPAPGPAAPDGATFAHHLAGDLIPGSGSGYMDRTVWAPGICFPMEESAFANSQVYDPGGELGPSGKTSQCDPSNYTLPWRDNFCETRGYVSPLCVSGTGHQGQDIRPATCQKAVHWVRAVESGIITDIGSYTVTLTAAAPPHRVYRYLHMQMDQLAVQPGSTVNVGDHLGKASNNFGSSLTTIHMHFEIRAGVSGTSTDGKPVVLHTFLPPYLSLLAAYQRQLDGVPCQ